MNHTDMVKYACVTTLKKIIDKLVRNTSSEKQIIS
jgi:hypothetical protein